MGVFINGTHDHSIYMSKIGKYICSMALYYGSRIYWEVRLVFENCMVPLYFDFRLLKNALKEMGSVSFYGKYISILHFVHK